MVISDSFVNVELVPPLAQVNGIEEPCSTKTIILSNPEDHFSHDHNVFDTLVNLNDMDFKEAKKEVESEGET